MGFIFRKSINLGPIRINFSKSGIGVSGGVPGLRVGRDAKGRRQASAGLPGSGLYWRKTGGGAARNGGCLVMLLAITAGLVLLGAVL